MWFVPPLEKAPSLGRRPSPRLPAEPRARARGGGSTRLSSPARWLRPALAPALLGSAALALPPAPSLTLQEAVAHAAERHPALGVAAAAVAEAESRLGAAGTYRFNPELEVERASVDAADGSVDASTLALSQEVEVGGQTRRRARVAAAELEAARAAMARDRLAVAASVKMTFAEAVRAREVLAVEEVDAGIARGFLATAEKRDAAGVGTEIELNLARAELGRAERRAHRARAGYMVARALLAEAVGIDAAAAPEPRGGVDIAPPLLPLADVLAAARAARPDLAGLRHLREAAAQRIELGRREAVPNVTVRLFDEREGDEGSRGASLSVSIPVFDRNRGAIAEVRAEGERLRWEVRRMELAVDREVVAAHATYEAARESARGIEDRVVGTLEENLRLLEKAFDAGKVGFTEILLIRRELVEARREHLEAQAEVWQAAVALELALAVDAPTATSAEAP